MSKLNSSFEQESWYSSIGGGCYWLYVRGVATANDSTYVAFANNMGNTGVAKFSSGGSYDWTYSTGTANNIADVAVDPGDGTIWGLANPGCGMYVCAYLYHLQDDGSWYSTLSNDYCYPSGGNEGRGLCLAVTKDRIYIGGMHWNGLRYAPWLMCLDRGTRTTIWNYVDWWPGPTELFRSVAASSSGVYAVMITDAGMGGYEGRLCMLDPATGATTFQSGICFSRSGSLGGQDYPGRVIAHPTFPEVIVAGTDQLYGFDSSCNPLWTVQVEPGSKDVVIGGIAATVAANDESTIGVAYTPAMGPYYARAVGWTLRTLRGAQPAQNELAVTPNVFDLWGSPGYVRFVVQGKAGSSVTVSVFDTTGQLLMARNVTLNQAGRGECKWDGRLDRGGHVSPGSYVGVATGPGVQGSARRSFLVTRGRASVPVSPVAPAP